MTISKEDFESMLETHDEFHRQIGDEKNPLMGEEQAEWSWILANRLYDALWAISEDNPEFRGLLTGAGMGN